MAKPRPPRKIVNSRVEVVYGPARKEVGAIERALHLVLAAARRVEASREFGEAQHGEKAQADEGTLTLKSLAPDAKEQKPPGQAPSQGTLTGGNQGGLPL